MINTPWIIETLKWVPAHASLLFTLAVVGYALSKLANPYVRYFTDFVDDNEIAMLNWMHGFYGDIIKGPRVIKFKKPGAEVIRKTTQPRKAESILEHIFTSEPLAGKPGFTIKVTLSIILAIDVDKINKDNFVVFHRVEDFLETSTLIDLVQFVDRYIRDKRESFSSSNPRDKSGSQCTAHIMGSQKEIEDKAHEEAEDYVRKVTDKAAYPFKVTIKLDLLDEVRAKMQAPGLQLLDNQAYQNKYKQVLAMFRGLIGGESQIPHQLAMLVALKLTDEEVDLSKAIFEIQGLDDFKGLLSAGAADTIAKALNNLSKKSRK